MRQPDFIIFSLIKISADSMVDVETWHGRKLDIPKKYEHLNSEFSNSVSLDR